MEASKDQSSTTTASVRSKLKYPLRSASKSKDEKPSAEIQTSSVAKRGKPVSSVSRSVSVLELSGKEKSAKPPRRLSIPARSAISPLPRYASGITPISETRAKKTVNNQGKVGTPASDASKSVNRRKFSVLSSASYWLTQIKLSEAASKHLISLGFFKLAVESGCEPLQRVRDELKLYARRHNLLDLGEPAKEILRSYNILEDLEQLQVSETCSVVPEEGSHTSEDDVQTSETENLKPKSLNLENIQSQTKSQAVPKDGVQKKISAGKNRSSVITNSANLNSATNTNSQRKSQRVNKQEIYREKGKIRNSVKKDAVEKGSIVSRFENMMTQLDSTQAQVFDSDFCNCFAGSIDPLLNQEPQNDKENLESLQMEETSVTTVQQ